MYQDIKSSNRRQIAEREEKEKEKDLKAESALTHNFPSSKNIKDLHANSASASSIPPSKDPQYWQEEPASS